MILDKETLLLDEVAYNDAAIATPVAFDLGRVRPGPGQPIKMFANNGGADIAGLTALTITDCDTTGGSYTALMTIPIGFAELKLATFFFDLPVHTRQFIKVAWTSIATSGTDISLGVVMQDQTNL